MNGKPKLINNINKYSEYRRIRFERTYRPLGRMTWWRVVLGVALLVFVLFLSGTVSNSFAARGRFKTAEALMVSPRWMETYRPELKAFIEAGVLYEDGALEEAFEAFDALGDLDAARTMRSVTAVKLAAQRLEGGDYDGACDAITEADPALLSEADAETRRLTIENLRAYYLAHPDSPGAADRLNSLPEAP